MKLYVPIKIDVCEAIRVYGTEENKMALEELSEEGRVVLNRITNWGGTWTVDELLVDFTKEGIADYMYDYFRDVMLEECVYDWDTDYDTRYTSFMRSVYKEFNE